MAPGNSILYDPISDLLSTNNTINIVAAVGTFLFGALAIYGCILSWRHQRWQRRWEEYRENQELSHMGMSSTSNRDWV